MLAEQVSSGSLQCATTPAKDHGVTSYELRGPDPGSTPRSFDDERKVGKVDATAAEDRRSIEAPPPTSKLMRTTWASAAQSAFSTDKLAWKSIKFGASSQRRSHLADGTELHIRHGATQAEQGAVSRTRRRISHMVGAPPSMRGIRKKPSETCATQQFPEPQQLPMPDTRVAPGSGAPAACRTSMLV